MANSPRELHFWRLSTGDWLAQATLAWCRHCPYLIFQLFLHAFSPVCLHTKVTRRQAGNFYDPSRTLKPNILKTESQGTSKIDSTGKGTCHQVQGPGFDPWGLQNRRRLNYIRCTHAVACICPAPQHTQNKSMNEQIIIYIKEAS